MKTRILIAIIFLLTLQAGFVRGEDAVIADGKTVKFDYSLTVNGEIIDSSQGKQPLEYVHGQGMIIPGLERELAGLRVGDQKSVSVPSADGYGPIDEQLFREFPKEMLGDGIPAQEGQMLQLQDNEGRVMPAMVTEVRDETVVLNFNHPLAGQDLEFDIKIVDIQ